MLNEKTVKQLLDDFEVESEEELYESLTQDSNSIACIICGKELPYKEIHFDDGDPYCKKCYRGINNDEE